jgi:katanin p60 ATPase-containing subunit A1
MSKGQGPSQPQGPISVTGVDPELVQRIEDEILDTSPNVSWDDISGMGDAKRLLNEAVVLPLIVPELFTGVLQPWKGVLLFGPPGTGKTMLAKAVAASAKTTFFNMSASTLIQKHFGDSEKMVRALFEVARARSPSTIFFDEVDALMAARGSNSEHEAMRRVKTELLRQMDGLHGGSSGGQESRVMVLATTNRPWDLDEAMRRRLEKRIYVPLPDMSGRLDILQSNTRKMQLDPNLRLEPVARRTDGFSGADLHLLCRNAGMMPMRRLVEGKSPEQLGAMKQRGEIILGSVMEDDFMAALDKMAPSVGRASLAEFEEWSREFGST